MDDPRENVLTEDGRLRCILYEVMQTAVWLLAVVFWDLCSGILKLVRVKRGGLVFAAPKCSSWVHAPLHVTSPVRFEFVFGI